jgi:hypothetical protein
VNFVTKGIADPNGDGFVDGGDYTVWADHFLQTVTGGKFEGDFNLDDLVDGGDYTIWADNYAPPPGLAATPVAASPAVEPAAQETSEIINSPSSQRIAREPAAMDDVRRLRGAIAWAAVVDRLATAQELGAAWSNRDLFDDWTLLRSRNRIPQR